MTERLALGDGLHVTLDSRGGEWVVTPRLRDGQAGRPGQGASEALVATLAAGTDLPAGWQVLRLATLTPATGERPVDVDQTNTSVVVGETLVVKWLRAVADRPHNAMAALAQLGAVGFDRMPTTYAVLTWTSPSGHTLPIAYVSDYLTAAHDGWTWCVDRVRSHGGDGAASLARDLGELTAALHSALATPNHIFPRPTQPAGASRVQRWHDGAFAMLDEALHLPDPETAAVVSARADAIARCFDDVLGRDQELAPTPVQHIHGDLHVGQVLQWSGGLAVVDFDGNPVAATDGGLMHPAARDVAQLSRSLVHVGEVVLRHHSNLDPDLDHEAVRRWMAGGRVDFLASYQQGLAERGTSALLDVRLLPAFEVEQELRELVYAARHLPRWAYAPLATLRDLVPVDSA